MDASSAHISSAHVRLYLRYLRAGYAYQETLTKNHQPTKDLLPEFHSRFIAKGEFAAHQNHQFYVTDTNQIMDSGVSIAAYALETLPQEFLAYDKSAMGGEKRHIAVLREQVLHEM
jgi:hypothetical protein